MRVPLLLALSGLVAACNQLPDPPAPKQAAAAAHDPVPGASSGPGVPVRGCPEEAARYLQPGRQTPGPLRLEEVICVPLQVHGVRFPSLSPDGTAVAHWSMGQEPVLEVAPLDGTEGLVFPNSTSSVFRTFAPRSVGDGGFAWADDSQSIWTVRQPSTPPANFALGPLEPIRVGRNGEVQALPALRDAAGPLDAIEWIGGNGLGIAQFGARGSYYRPEHDDPSPTLALVDARRGRVLDVIDLLRSPIFAPRLGRFGFHPSAVAGAILPDGRIRAIVQLPPIQDPAARARGTMPRGWGDWLVWTQSEPPRLLAASPDASGPRRIAISPDGTRLLAYLPIQPTGLIVEHAPSPPPESVTGIAAEMVDLATGRRLWRTEARAARYWDSPETPGAFSPDGRLLLFALPPVEREDMNYVLVEARTGRVVQRLAPMPTASPTLFGFTADGRRVWFTSGTILYFYRLGRR